MSDRRLRNLIRRMAEGDEFYTNDSPRITRSEIAEIEAKGFRLQIEHIYGASAGPIAVYPLHPNVFKTQASKFLKTEAD